MTPHSRISRAKIAIPAGNGTMLGRPTVSARLDTCLAHRLTLISAPAGSGKTVLAAEWARKKSDRCNIVWVTLDEADRDPVRVLRYVVAALRMQHPQLGRDVWDLLTSPRPAAPSDLLHYLLEDLETIDEDTIVFFDDFHLADCRLMRRALAELVQSLPSRVHVVLLTRHQPGLSLSYMRIKGWVAELTREDLWFGPTEAQEFLSQTVGVGVSATIAGRLHARTEGWPAALRIAALSMRQAEAKGGGAMAEDLAERFGGQHPFMLEFAVNDVLGTLSRDARHVLKECSVVSEFTVPLCRALVPGDALHAVIRELEHAYLLSSRTKEGSIWYACPELLRDALKATLEPEHATRLHRLATSWFEHHDKPLQALDHAFEAHDIEASVRLLCCTFDHSLQSGKVQQILERIESLPSDAVHKHLDLVGYKAWLLCLVGRSVDARQYADKALEQRAGLPCQHGSAALHVFRVYYELNWGTASLAVDAARAALATPSTGELSVRIMFGSFLGQALLRIGRPTEAIAAWREAMQLGRGMQKPPAKTIDVLFHLAPLLIAQGQLREALTLCEDALQRNSGNAGQAATLAGPIHVTTALILHELGELRDAKFHAEQGLALCRALGIVYYELHALKVMAHLRWALGERESAWQALAQSRERLVIAPSPRRTTIVEMLAAEMHLSAGQLQPALKALKALESDNNTSLDSVSLLHARAELLKNRPQAALDMLEGIESRAQATGFDGTRIAVKVLMARCWHLIGNKANERRHLERGLVMASFCGARRVLLEAGPWLSETIQFVASAAPDFAATLHWQTSVTTEEDHALPGLLDALTQRDIEVLTLLTRGMRNQEIADQLQITVGTTKQYVNRLFAKLGARNRVEAVSIGRRLQLLR